MLADNGADVFINGVKFLQDSASDHDPVYWNNVVPVNGTNTTFVAGARCSEAYNSPVRFMVW